MTLCPIAIIAGCQKCPAFRICPAKSLLGDVPKAPPPTPPAPAAKAAPRTAPKQRAPRKPVAR